MRLGRRFFWRSICIACSGGAFSSCADATATQCAVSTNPAIRLSLASGLTAMPVNANTTIVYERQGDDSLSIIRTLTSDAPIPVGSRPGVYEIRAITPGYADWLTTGVVVDADGCEPKSISLVAFLQPNT